MSSSSSVPPGKQQLQMFLTDGPVNYQEVLIDIKTIAVLVKTDSCSAAGFVGQDSTFPCYHWDTLNITPGVYNILDFSNGVDTLFSNTAIDQGKIVELKLTLGDSNYVVADSIQFPLYLTCSHTLTIVVDDVQPVNQNTFQLWLDFDAAHSVVEVERHHFTLTPRIRLFTPRSTATLEGAVKPDSADAFVAVADGTDTLIALPGREGRWEIRGIKNSSVNVLILPTNDGFQDSTINNVGLTPGMTTNLGTITLHQ